MDRQPLKSGLITLMAGLSATAIFAATGFIAAFGREQFLGINLSDWSVQTLTLLAGRCAADSFFLVLNLIALHWIVIAICLIVVGAGVVAMNHRKFPAWVAPAAESALAIPLLIWLLTVTVSFEAPTIPMRGWIMAPDAESPLSSAIRELHPQARPQHPEASREYVKSAISKTTASPGVTRLQKVYYAKRPDGPGVLLLEAASDDVGQQMKTIGFRYHKRDDARDLLYSEYAQAVTVCILALLYLLLSRQCPESKFWSDLLRVVRVGVILASGVATLLLPYVYGKLIDSTLFANASITYTQPATDSPDGKATLITGEFPVISQTDSQVSLLWIQGGGGHTKILEVPRDKIVSMDLGSEVDALSKISECISSPGTQCQ